MKKELLISLLIFGSAISTQAQTTDSSPTPRATVGKAKVKETFKQKMLAQYSANDTARAVINLFSKRQGGGAGWILAAALFTVRGVTAANGAYSTSINGTVVEERDANKTPFIIIGSAAAGYGVSKLVRFSNSDLEKTLTTYQATNQLPAWVRKRLKPKFFKAPRRMNERV